MMADRRPGWLTPGEPFVEPVRLHDVPFRPNVALMREAAERLAFSSASRVEDRAWWREADLVAGALVEREKAGTDG